MKKPSKLFSLLIVCILVTLTIGIGACEKTESPIGNDCTQKAIYKGTNVCHRLDGNNQAAAAIEVASDGNVFILENFFEIFTDSSLLVLNDTIYIDFEPVGKMSTPSPALCGPLIIAPVTKATCISLDD